MTISPSVRFSLHRWCKILYFFFILVHICSSFLLQSCLISFWYKM